MRRLGLKGIGFLSAIVYAANALHHGWTPPAAKSAMDDLQAWLTGTEAALFTELAGRAQFFGVRDAVIAPSRH